MKITSILEINSKERRTQKEVVFHTLLAVIVMTVLTGGVAHAQYPFLLLDISNNKTDTQLETGFTPFTIADSGSEIDGITVEITPMTGSIDARWRWAPVGIPYEQIYRDFVFTRPGGMRITLSGLTPNETYEITMYAYDTASAGDRIADWYNADSNDLILTTSFSGGADPAGQSDYAFSGMTQADENGSLVLEARPNPSTVEQSGANNPYAFLNALVVSSLTPVNIARRPVPENGAIITTNTVDLQWTPGNTSVSSNVYVGESFDDVNNATTANTDIFRGNTVNISYPIGAAGQPYPDGLVEETTYYWRIDEVEEDGKENKGNVWSFTVAPKKAFFPVPVDGSLFADPNLTLQWTPGAGATGHRVFFGDNLENVQAGTGGTDKGTVTDTSYSTGLLERDKTYYWRIEESDGTNTYPGDVWSFTTTLEDLGTIVMEIWEDIEGSPLIGLTDNVNYPDNPTRREQLTAFDTGQDAIGTNYGGRIHGWLYVPVTGDYTFYFTCSNEGQLWLSTDDDPANIQELAHELVWGSYDTFSHITDPIPLVAGEKYYIMAIWKHGANWEHCQAAWKGPGIREMEVIQGSYLSPFEPVTAFDPDPANGSVEAMIDSVLSWVPGKYAATQDIYLGTDFNDVNNVDPSNLASYPNVTSATITESNYVPELLDFNTTYYWRVDTVNNGHPDSPWKSTVWSFTTGNYIVIDDFERYTDYPPNEIWATWTDGYDNPAVNGSTIGYPDPDFANGEHYVETDTVLGGDQSAPLVYDNSAASYSEVTLSTDNLTIGQDWTVNNVNVLRLWFYGDPNNAASEQLYVKLNNSKILINSINVTDASWQSVDINLSDFGINLASITKIIIGLERTGATGGSGMLFMDDLRLYLITP